MRLSALIFLICITSATFSQVIQDSIFSSSIKTVEIYRKGWQLSYPIISLNSGDKLLFSFDELGSDIKNYSYSIIHCDVDWSKSALYESDYMEGFEVNDIENYDNGFNSVTDYVNYQVEIPNENVSLKVSGNYIIKVFEDTDSENPIIQKRFWVSEELVGITTTIKRPMVIEHIDIAQQVELKVSHASIEIDNAIEDVYIEVRQNNRQDVRISGIKPTFIRQNELVYQLNPKTILPAGNEFRNLNMYNLKYLSEDVDSIWFHNGKNHVRLYADKSRADKPYFSNEDFNGRFYITTEDNSDSKREGDYADVHFTLNCDLPQSYGKVYLYGALTNWKISPQYEMKYDFVHQSYYKALTLKQGYYDYAYVYVDNSYGKVSFDEFEGNFFNTENDYIVFVYLKDKSLNTDKLIGYSIKNYKY